MTTPNSGNNFPHVIGPGISRMGMGPGDSLSGILDYGSYMISCELTDDSLAGAISPQLTVKDASGNTVSTITRPGHYPFAQGVQAPQKMTVTAGGDAMWRRVSVNRVDTGLAANN